MLPTLFETFGENNVLLFNLTRQTPSDYFGKEDKTELGVLTSILDRPSFLMKCGVHIYV